MYGYVDMRKGNLRPAKILTFQLSFGILLMIFLLTNISPSPGHGRGDERLIDIPPTDTIRNNQQFHQLKIVCRPGGVSCMTLI